MFNCWRTWASCRSSGGSWRSSRDDCGSSNKREKAGDKDATAADPGGHAAGATCRGAGANDSFRLALGARSSRCAFWEASPGSREDAAHAFGLRCREGHAGTLGDAGCLSFDPIQNITCGEGGAIVTSDEGAAAKHRRTQNFGIDADVWRRLSTEPPWYYEVSEAGLRNVMTDRNASTGLVPLNAQLRGSLEPTLAPVGSAGAFRRQIRSVCSAKRRRGREAPPA
ncbi:MAG: DegT/DnrJ/EryC1/StrS family aminotransferase [Bryobacteraceae bacterium]